MNAGDEVAGDPIDYTLMGPTSIIDAKSYNYFVTLSSEDEKNYYALDTASLITITPRPVDVVWSNETLTYNGSVQAPAATANGVAADGQLSVTVSGGQKNAGENYTAHASTTNENYTLRNVDRPFEIKRKEVYLTIGDATVVYGGSLGAVDYSFRGFAPGDDQSMFGEIIFRTVPAIGDKDYNVGTFTDGVTLDDTKGADSRAANYILVSDYGNLTITPRTVEIEWSRSAGSAYNGGEHYVTATVFNAVGNDALNVTLSNDRFTDAGDYTARVESVTGERAGNYVFSNEEYVWHISKRYLSISWLGNNTGNSYIYNGKAQGVQPVVTGLLARDEDGWTAENLTAVDCGRYTAEIILSDKIIKNYEYTAKELTCGYNIGQAGFSVHLEHDGQVIAESASGLTRTVDCYIGCTATWQTEAKIKTTVTTEGGEESAITDKSVTFNEAGTYILVIKADDPNYTDGLFTVKFVINERPD